MFPEHTVDENKQIQHQPRLFWALYAPARKPERNPNNVSLFHEETNLDECVLHDF